MIKKTLFVTIILFLTSCASKYETSLDEYRKNNLVKAVEICREDDSHGCRFIKGMGYLLGKGFERDPKKGVELIKGSADKGIAQAQSELGVMYIDGIGVPQDYLKGMELMKLSADKMNPLGLYNMALIYSQGKITEKDYEKALNYAAQSFDKGRIDAALLSGKILLKQKKTDKALKWFKRGSERGDVNCDYTMGYLFEAYKSHRDLRKSFFWYRKAAKKGHTPSANKLAFSNYYGKGLPVNKDAGLNWYQYSATRNNVNAQFMLGILYQHKPHQNFIKSLYWLEKAAKGGHIKAETQTGFHFLKGNGVKKDERKAFLMFSRSAKKGDLESIFIVGRCYEGGIGTEKDIKKAVDIFKFAAEKGHSAAVKKIVSFYIHGRYLKKNCKKALEWLNKASGHNPAFLTDTGFFLFSDKYCKRDIKLAIKYFLKAAFKGEAKAQEMLAAIYNEGKFVKRDRIEAYAWVNIALSKVRTKKGIKLRNSIEEKMSIEELRRAQKRTRLLIKETGGK